MYQYHSSLFVPPQLRSLHHVGWIACLTPCPFRFLPPLCLGRSGIAGSDILLLLHTYNQYYSAYITIFIVISISTTTRIPTLTHIRACIS
ncbi:hypothetical protein GYMLUDRAFT_42140 [Collybiopsis luxurians FD-317 M1]|uniref:Uncharacterized protein n=1 Tax=Collybiopsis luxurians FD-317 M1 TaxID=944289 RepID=A0A0D0BEE3_9AGAR|nr:hypothetical protein GYMLUDRAFT_42140 [Collybiopsis luxurians FD-317 M1]